MAGEAASLFRALERREQLEDTDEVLAVLQQFDELGLLEKEEGATRTRRRFLGDLVAAAAIPVITTIALSTPAAAQSGVTEAQCDASSGEFCGQACTDFAIGTRVCASVSGVAGGACGCVPVPGVCACT